MKVHTRPRARWVAAFLAVVLASGVLSACQVAKAGAKCFTTDFGRDSTYVLQCKGGRWVRIMTIRDYLILLKRIQDSQTTTTTPWVPPPAGPAPVSSWSLVGDVGISNPDAADGVNDGIGYATVVVGRTAYIGGSFGQVTNGTRTVAKANLAAFDIFTGQLVETFSANTNGKVMTLASDGTKLFVGGAFTTVNGQTREHFAAVDLATGAPYGGNWVKNTGSRNVFSIAVTWHRVYLGGNFVSVSGTAASKVVALDRSTGAIDGSFDPGDITPSAVDSVAATLDDSRVYIGGTFTSVGGTSGAGATNLAELDGSGNLQHPSTGFVGASSSALGLETTGTNVLAAFGGDDNEVARYAPGGSRAWTTGDLCKGDAQAVHLVGSAAYAGFHQSCKDSFGNYDPTYHLVKVNAATGAVDYGFKPVFDGYWGVWGLGGNAQALVAVGQFDHVNGAAHKGFVIFSPAP
jgi:hypothetical protein